MAGYRFLPVTAGTVFSPVMAGHSRPKDGVASARLCPAIHVLLLCVDHNDVDARDKPGHDDHNKKAPAKPGPSISQIREKPISANRIRRSDAATSAPRTARPTAPGCGRISPSSWSDRLRENQARRAREAGSLPALA